VRTLLLSLLTLPVVGLTLPLGAHATPLGMDPGSVFLQWTIPGNPDGAEGDLRITFVSGETDGATTVLTLEFAIRHYHYEPSGSFTFDVPIISAVSPTVELLYHSQGLNAIQWTYLYGCCVPYPGFNRTLTLTFELAGVPSGGEFTIQTESASVAFAPIPEPSTSLLVIGGLLCLACRRRART